MARTREEAVGRAEPLTEAQLGAILLRLSRRFAWEEPSGVTVVERWDSRTASLYRCRQGNQRGDVVLKLGRGWTADDARRLDAELRALREGVSPEDFRVPAPLGWDGDPPSVCTEYVDGADVILMYADPGLELWRGTGLTPADLAAACGRALGAYHRLPGGKRAGALDEVRNDLLAAARPMAALGAARRLVPEVAVGRRYGDMGPHQFRVDGAGRLYLLDPPVSPGVAPVYGDLARFVFGLDRGVARGTRGREGRRARRALPEAFYGGYAERGPVDPRLPRERWLVGLYAGAVVAGMARKRWALRLYRDSVRYGWRWLRFLVALRLRPPR